MARLYYANQYDGPFQRPHNQHWELDKADNGPFVRGDWKGVPYDPPTRIKRDCGPFVRNDLKVKTACDVTEFVADDSGHLLHKHKDPCGIPFYGNYRGTWDLPGTILGQRERHVMGRRTASLRSRCVAEEVKVGVRGCRGQWSNCAKAKQDAWDLGADRIYPEDLQKQEIKNWEECAGRKMPWKVGKHTDAITLTPVPRLKRFTQTDLNSRRCRRKGPGGRRGACAPEYEMLIVMATLPAPPTTLPPLKIRDAKPKAHYQLDCLKKCVAKCDLSVVTDNWDSCEERGGFQPSW